MNLIEKYGKKIRFLHVYEDQESNEEGENQNSEIGEEKNSDQVISGDEEHKEEEDQGVIKEVIQIDDEDDSAMKD